MGGGCAADMVGSYTMYGPWARPHHEDMAFHHFTTQGCPLVATPKKMWGVSRGDPRESLGAMACGGVCKWEEVNFLNGVTLLLT